MRKRQLPFWEGRLCAKAQKLHFGWQNRVLVNFKTCFVHLNLAGRRAWD